MSALAEYISGRRFAGDANEVAGGNRGWMVGNFPGLVPDQLITSDIEIKYDRPLKGTIRNVWSANRKATTLSMILEGKQTLYLPGEEHHFGSEQFWLTRPGVPHKWAIEEDAFIITVRFPGIKADAVELTDEQAHDVAFLRTIAMEQPSINPSGSNFPPFPSSAPQ
jgi:hypothetical protein